MNKAEMLMHPVRIKICMALMRHNNNGLTPLEMVKLIHDVPQATLYRHIQVLFDADIIRVINEKKVRSVTEKYYVLNEENAHVNAEEWDQVPNQEKLDYYSYFQLSLMNQYQDYLDALNKREKPEDRSTFSLAQLQLDEESYASFLHEMNDLMRKYYKQSNQQTEENTVRTIGITIIPE